MDAEQTFLDNWDEMMVRFFNNELTLAQEKQLNDWIKLTPENKQRFEQNRIIWLQSTLRTHENVYNSNAAWDKISKKGKNSKTLFTLNRYLKVAAAVVIVFLAGFLTSRLTFKTPFDSVKICEISTPLGSKTFCVLPDGSEVWLNAGSKLVYPKSFDEKERKVSLTGEAFFKVKTNKNKPFIVATSKMNVRAYGTQFNVKAYPDENTISATLVEGIVKVDGIEGKHKFEYTLKPNQNITILKNQNESQTTKIESSKNVINTDKVADNTSLPEEIKNVKTELHTSWKDSRWNIEAEPLNSLAVLLERRFNIKIYVENTELSNYKFTGTIQNETLEQVLKFLSLTTPLEFKVGKGEVWWDIDHKKAFQYSKILDMKD